MVSTRQAVKGFLSSLGASDNDNVEIYQGTLSSAPGPVNGFAPQYRVPRMMISLPSTREEAASQHLHVQARVGRVAVRPRPALKSPGVDKKQVFRSRTTTLHKTDCTSALDTY